MMENNSAYTVDELIEGTSWEEARSGQKSNQ